MADFAKIQNFDSDFGFDENFSFSEEVGTIIADNDLFGVPTVIVYLGAVGESQKYVGLRTEFQLYVGTGNLWP